MQVKMMNISQLNFYQVRAEATRGQTKENSTISNLGRGVSMRADSNRARKRHKRRRRGGKMAVAPGNLEHKMKKQGSIWG